MQDEVIPLRKRNKDRYRNAAEPSEEMQKLINQIPSDARELMGSLLKNRPYLEEKEYLLFSNQDYASMKRFVEHSYEEMIAWLKQLDNRHKRLERQRTHRREKQAEQWKQMFDEWIRQSGSQLNIPGFDPIKTEAYRVLGLSPVASQDQVKQTWRCLAKVHHPDTGGNVQTFLELKKAYEIIINR